MAITGSIGFGTLPSSSTTPFPTSDPFAHLLAAPVQGLTPAQQEWADWVAAHPISSTALFNEPNSPVVYNTSVFVDDEGKLLGIYEKRNLWHPER